MRCMLVVSLFVLSNGVTAQEQVVLAEGKTKIIRQTLDPTLVEIESKDDITAFNGKFHDVIPDKGALVAFLNSSLILRMD